MTHHAHSHSHGEKSVVALQRSYKYRAAVRPLLGRTSVVLCAFLLILVLAYVQDTRMRLYQLATTALGLLGLSDLRPATALTSNNLTDLVQWDPYSLYVMGQRIFLWSGEFHTWRLPVPDLWPDILQKAKAAGMNTISIYVHWGLTNPSNGTVDFTGVRALAPLFDAALASGLWVVVRPGPYINAETTAGGIAHWVTSEVAGHLRTNATDYESSWVPYIKGIIEECKPYQITEGGPIIAVQIDNEYTQADSPGWPGKAEYFEQLEALYRSEGIVVPLTYNDPGMGDNFAHGPGSVDIYGLDSYPQSFDCSNPYVWNPVVTNYYTYHMQTSPEEPFYIPEFQGGAFDPWGPNAPGYDNCRILTDSDFEQIFYLNLWANNVKMANFYMLYGGTSWGYLAFHGVYTSYDYGASIAETRILTPKFAELKREGLFLRSVPEFYKTDVIGNTTTSAVEVSSPLIFGTYLRNPDTGAGFYLVRQQNSSSLETVTFTLQANTSEGVITLPQDGSSITLTSRASKVIVHDLYFGSSHLLYSTAAILFAGTIGERDVLFLYGPATDSHEAAFKLSGTSSAIVNTSGPLDIQTSTIMDGTHTMVDVLPGTTGLSYIWDSPSSLVLFADSDTAGTFWAPTIAQSSATQFQHFYQFGTNETVLVGGPYLVRNASISGDTLELRGDLNDTTYLVVLAPSSVTKVTWNGDEVELDAGTSKVPSATGVLTATLTPKLTASSISLPSLNEWKYADSLPEVSGSYDDSYWTTADKYTTNIPYKPIYGDGPILYGCDYGYCEGAVLWRGHFQGTGNETGIELLINGGEAFAASVWLNSKFIGTTYGNSSNNLNILEETNTLFPFQGAVIPGVDNVVTVIQDNMGLNETQDDNADTSKCPRGIRGYEIRGHNYFTEWKVQGKLGGYTNFPDKTRGVFNEGGFYGERAGWHLPGFDDSAWESRSLSTGLSIAGVGMFRTTFDLNIPSGLDVPISFDFDSSFQPYRALLFVNGWQVGRRVANLGPQYSFPVQQGILDYSGTNTVAVLLWAMEDAGAHASLNMTINGVFEGGVGAITLDNPQWSSRGQHI
ncbi:glycoside hydrolase family 35 protein [Dacryopinax primogenitus]|uniref:beta-galactosidase n=1 Tax=Dacryopinax primogenitus (strain DJM 731) TaxID=1858805 RepID=M5G9R9_DACPD|nr:glycoside hydrolase family 35 protein [Dacryopinax primogenitus]EJU05035.1 glycoside hydrolase family 35 protein [Dacryopinax primogenitus]